MDTSHALNEPTGLADLDPFNDDSQPDRTVRQTADPDWDDGVIFSSAI